MNIHLASHARRDMKKLPAHIAERIAEKLQWLAMQEDPLEFAEPLHGLKEKLYRFRIGDYRAIFRIDAGGIVTILLVLAVRHRREAYR